MTNNNTHATPTLNVDGKGAKSIKAYGTTAPTVWWKAGDVVTFVYDGTNWIMGVAAGEIEQINQNLTELGTIKYDEVSDNVYVKRDGMWVVWKKAYLDNLYIYSDGQFKSGYSIGQNSVYESGTVNNAPLTLSNDSLYIEQYVNPSDTTQHGGGSWLNGIVDMTNYTYLKANITCKAGTQDVVVNVSALSGNYLICLCTVEYTGASGSYFTLAAAPSAGVVQNVSNKTTITAATQVASGTRTTITINSLWLE